MHAEKDISVAAVDEARRLASYPGSPYKPGYEATRRKMYQE